jgi:acyl-CoA thioester hydrolase
MQPFTHRIRVRYHDLDALNHVNNAVYVNYLLEAALDASTAAGFSPAWYRQQGTGWVHRRLIIRYHLPAAYGDELDVTTWIAALQGESGTRDFRIARVSDGALVVRARVESVFTDLETGAAAALPAALAQAFCPTAEAEDLAIRLTAARKTDDAHRYRCERRVQFHELDATGRASPAAVLHWVGQAYFDAIRTAGQPLERMRRHGWLVLQGGHDIEYFAPAQGDDPIEVVSWICEMGRVRGAWTHEVYHAESGRLLARDYSLGVFVDLEGRPTAPPPGSIADVLRGPVSP